MSVQKAGTRSLNARKIRREREQQMTTTEQRLFEGREARRPPVTETEMQTELGRHSTEQKHPLSVPVRQTV